MMEFLICIGEYLIKALFFVAVAGLGAFIGIKMRKNSDAKKAAAATTEEQKSQIIGVLFTGYLCVKIQPCRQTWLMLCQRHNKRFAYYNYGGNRNEKEFRRK